MSSAIGANSERAPSGFPGTGYYLVMLVKHPAGQSAIENRELLPETDTLKGL